MLVAFEGSFTGAGNAAMLATKFAPGLFLLNRLKNSMNGINDQRSWKVITTRTFSISTSHPLLA